MKMNIIKHIATAAIPAALLLTGLTAAAQNYAEGEYELVGGIAFNKTAKENPTKPGSYIVQLESFVTGKVHSETVKSAADVIVLLDISASMDETGGYDNRTYTERTPGAMTLYQTKTMTRSSVQNWSYNSFDAAGEKIWSYLYNGMYYPVYPENITSGPESGRGRHIYIMIPNPAGGSDLVKRYIYGTEGDGEILHETPNTTPTSAGETIYRGTLYSGGWKYSDFTTAPSDAARNYFIKYNNDYYPVLHQTVRVGSINTYQQYVYLPEGKRYLQSSESAANQFSETPYGNYASNNNTLYIGELYRGGGWTSASITTGTSTSGHYYLHTDGKYYPVRKGVRVTVDGNNTYQATVRLPDGLYYLNGSTVSKKPYPNPFADPDCIVFFGPLYQVASYSGAYEKEEGLRRAMRAFIDGLAQKSKEDNLNHRLAIVEFNSPAGDPGDPTDTRPNLTATSPIDNRNSHVVVDFREMLVESSDEPTINTANVSELKAAFPNQNLDLTLGSYYARGYNIARGLIRRETNSDANYTKRPKIIITIGDFQVAEIGNAREQATALKGLDNTQLVSVQVRPGFSDLYDGYAQELASKPELYFKAESFDEQLIETLMMVTNEIGGAEIELESSVVAVDIVSQAFSIPDGTEPELKVAPLIPGGTKDPVTKLDGKTYVYYEFGDEVSPEEAFPAAEAEQIQLIRTAEKPNEVSTQGFDYTAHWCGPDNNSSTEWHEGGYKIILRFEVEPNDDAVGGPEVQTNTEDSGIYVDVDGDGNKEKIASFNQPTVKLPVQLWIQKDGLTGNDSAVFTIYYADPRTADNAGKSPHEMTYESFTKVIVHATDLVDGKAMVKITGLDQDFYYKIKEDAWAWSYDYQTKTGDEVGVKYSSDVMQNPIQFVNKPKETVKHAESFVTNEFESSSE